MRDQPRRRCGGDLDAELGFERCGRHERRPSHWAVAIDDPPLVVGIGRRRRLLPASRNPARSVGFVGGNDDPRDARRAVGMALQRAAVDLRRVEPLAGEEKDVVGARIGGERQAERSGVAGARRHRRTAARIRGCCRPKTRPRTKCRHGRRPHRRVAEHQRGKALLADVAAIGGVARREHVAGARPTRLPFAASPIASGSRNVPSAKIDAAIGRAERMHAVRRDGEAERGSAAPARRRARRPAARHGRAALAAADRGVAVHRCAVCSKSLAHQGSSRDRPHPAAFRAHHHPHVMRIADAASGPPPCGFSRVNSPAWNSNVADIGDRPGDRDSLRSRSPPDTALALAPRSAAAGAAHPYRHRCVASAGQWRGPHDGARRRRTCRRSAPKRCS